MCGIAGIFDRSGTPPERTLLVRMTEALAHRGPDGEGYFVHEAAALGHRRLSIIDVEGGAQPIGNEDGSLQVVFNGEIYNFVELRQELIELGHRFARVPTPRSSSTPTSNGATPASIDFNGMFAFAL